MTCTPPPKGCDKGSQQRAVHHLSTNGWAFSARPSTTPLGAIGATGLSPQADRLLPLANNEHLYLLAARELDAHVRIEWVASDRWGDPMSPDSVGPIRLRWVPSLDQPAISLHPFSLPERHRAELQADIATSNQLPRMQDPELSLATEMHTSPHVLIAEALGLKSDQGVFIGEVIDTVMLVGCGLTLDLKDRLSLPRPWESGTWNPSSSPSLPQPKHSSYPGGHALQLTGLLTVLRALMPSGSKSPLDVELTRLTDRLIEQRRLGGLHTKIDNDDGAAIGAWLGDRLIAAASDAANHPRWSALWELASREWP